MAPETFLRVLDSQPFSVAYAQPSRRPADGRYGENPNRLFKHTQFQVILKPPPVNVLEIYLESLTAIGIDLRQHDLKFEEDNWEAPTLGAWGIGWQVMLDGLEVTQFTYFQQCGGLDLDPICAEITYGLERIAAFLQDVDSVYDIVWAAAPRQTAVAVTMARFGISRRCSSPSTTLSMPMWKSFGSISASTRRSAGTADLAARRGATRRVAPPSDSAGLRSLPQVLAPLQSARCPRRDLRDRTRGRHRPHSHPGGRRRQLLRMTRMTPRA